MRICFDIDGTLCLPAEGTDYKFVFADKSVVEYVQQLKRAGHTIVLHTARGSGTGTDWRHVTERQLAEWGVPYDELIFGKPYADLYVDDRAVNVSDFEKVMRVTDPVGDE